MKPAWNLKTCINFDYLHQLDTLSDTYEETDLHTRDRSIFLQEYGEQENSSVPDPEKLIFTWFKHRSEAEEATTVLPGKKGQERHRKFGWLMFLAGGVTGAALAGSYFIYTGSTPLNVFVFFSIFILPQLFMVAVFLLGNIFRRLKGSPQNASRLIKLLYQKTSFILDYVTKKPPAATPYSQKGMRLKQSHLHTWPLFLSGQLFGIGFNLGIIALTGLKIATTDLAFGWQTTLSFGPEALYQAAQIIAAPWSWLIPAEIAYPSLEQIEGSRIILKEGIAGLVTSDLRAWWPFLLMSIITYGLVPRTILLIFSALAASRSYTRLWRAPQYSGILRRMTTPVMSTQAAPLAEAPVSITAPHFEQSSSARQQKKGKTLALISADIFDVCEPEIISSFLPWQPAELERLPIFQDYGGDQKLLGSFAEKDNLPKNLLILVEAWMVPISEQINFIGRISEIIAPEKPYLLLLGKPEKHSGFSQLSPEQISIWLNRLGPLEERLIPLHQRVTREAQSSDT